MSDKLQTQQEKSISVCNADNNQHDSTMIRLAPTDIEINLSRATKIPFDQIASFGVAFASLPDAFRTVTQTTTLSGTTGLLQAFDNAGNLLDISRLQHFKDGSGLLGSFRDQAKGFGQARFREAGPLTAQSVATLPYDPTMIAMGVALSQINAKLDAIQKTQQEMFDYLKQKDKARLRGDLQTLADMLEGYEYNWNNETFRNNKHAKALDIRQDAEQSIIHLRAQIKAKLNDKPPVDNRLRISKHIDEIVDRLKEYRLSVYLYAFATFLEVLMLGNFTEAYLKAMADKIETHSMRYREMYTACYNLLEANSEKAIDSLALDGLAFVGKKLGQLVASTPVGKHTPIDEALEDSGNKIDSFNDAKTKKLLNSLVQAKDPDTIAFREGLLALDSVCNRPSHLFADAENLYLLPAEDHV